MKKILLIEDDANLAFMVTDGLESEGFDVFHMNNGEDLMMQWMSSLRIHRILFCWM